MLASLLKRYLVKRITKKGTLETALDILEQIAKLTKSKKDDKAIAEAKKVIQKYK